MSQKKIFLESEGDSWFNRNHERIQGVEEAIKSPDVCYTIDALTAFSGRINRILEIGCSNGIKLEAICCHFNAEGVGVDPSLMAVKNGNDRDRRANTTLVVGTGDKLPPHVCPDSSFDIVFFAFCLYLIDRDKLIQSLSEADRVLKPGGFLVVTDFDPGSNYKKVYSHFEGIFSYKQDYASFYTRSGLYYLVGKRAFSHRAQSFDEMPDERISTSILYKETDPYPMRG